MTDENNSTPTEHQKGPKCAFCSRTEDVRWCHLSGFGERKTRIAVCRECFPTLNETHPNASASVVPTMTETEMRRETRRQKALDRLGSDNPRCRVCGQNYVGCLELHHLEGEAFGQTLVVVCRNCHRKLSDLQKDDPPQIGDPPSAVERAVHFLSGLQHLFAELGKSCEHHRDSLIPFLGNKEDKS